MSRTQRAWLIRVYTALGIGLSLTWGVILLVDITDWLGLTSKVALLRLLDSQNWYEALMLAGWVILVGVFLFSDIYVWPRYFQNDATGHENGHE